MAEQKLPMAKIIAALMIANMNIKIKPRTKVELDSPVESPTRVFPGNVVDKYSSGFCANGCTAINTTDSPTRQLDDIVERSAHRAQYPALQCKLRMSPFNVREVHQCVLSLSALKIVLCETILCVSLELQTAEAAEKNK
eukprot:m.897 g.897  ORF g.897 m.897 type:complete len:139 (+) comp1439_c0_seq1:487-903(+)